MKKLTLFLFIFVITTSLQAAKMNLFSENYLSNDVKVEVELYKVQLAPYLNDYNTFFFGDDDFEMFISLNGTRQVEFDLKSNSTDRKKTVRLYKKFSIDIGELNQAISKRRDSQSLTEDEKLMLIRKRTGHLCLLDDSLVSPEFISTSYYGCFDLVSTIQEMLAMRLKSKNIYVEKNTTFPKTNDPAKAKLFKSWYRIKISK